MPAPRKNEQKDKFISRCIRQVINEGRESKQAAAICYSIWRESKKEKSLIIKVINHNINKSEPSILINNSILINAPRLNKKINIDNLLLTHCHGINLEGIEKIETKNMYILDNQKHIRFLKHHVKECDQKYNITRVKEYVNIDIDGLTITPILVKHQVQEIYGDDCLGFIFNKKVAYIAPCHSIPKKTINYLKDIDVLIIDGGYAKNELYKDHKSIFNTLREFKETTLKYIYFIGTFRNYKIQGKLKGTDIKIDTLFRNDIIKICI